LGQKTHPVGFRLGITRQGDSRWFSGKNYTTWLHEDIRLRGYIKKKLYHAGISKITIERAADKTKVNIFTARPGVLIGKKGAGIEEIKKDVERWVKNEIALNIQEVRKPELDATLVAENIASQLEKRIAFRRAMKKSVLTAMKFGAKGIKIMASGRLAGAEIARREWYREGRVPLHTLRADIDFGTAEANTTYGKVGIKVWIFKGEILGKKLGKE
jgi:small subunit ribosomal protein S3